MEIPTFRLEKVVKDRHNEYEDFIGPLDLILHLLAKNKVEIKDIMISDILDQYIAYLDRMKRMDMEIASEFIAMASHLMYIKTRMLLSIDDREANEEMSKLIASLEEHRREEDYIKIGHAVEKLRSRYEDIGKNIITKSPEILEKNKDYPYTHDVKCLADALSDIFDRSSRRVPPPMTAFAGIVGREPYPVSEKVSQILRRIMKNGVERLKSLIGSAGTKSEIVATFLAVLEMCKNRKILITDINEKSDYKLELVRGKEEYSVK